MVEQLWKVGITAIYVDGSFVEEKDHPNDIDGYFECELTYLPSGSLTQDLNKLDPNRVWTWDPASRSGSVNSTKRQLPMWHFYRVELYPHVGQLSGIKDEFGNDLQFPAAFRKSRTEHRQKGIIKLVKGKNIDQDSEYQECLKRLEDDRRAMQAQREKLEELNLPADQIELVMAPLLSFNCQLKEEVEWYERVKRRDFGVFTQLTEIGPLLVALRISNGISQAELAKRLAVDVSQISRDERNEYHGISIERAERVVAALGEELQFSVCQKKQHNDLLAAS